MYPYFPFAAIHHLNRPRLSLSDLVEIKVKVNLSIFDEEADSNAVQPKEVSLFFSVNFVQHIL